MMMNSCKVHRNHDFLIKDGCPACGGELFGPCGCCECYFCHGICEVPIYDDEEIKEFGIDKVKPELWKNIIDGE